MPGIVAVGRLVVVVVAVVVGGVAVAGVVVVGPIVVAEPKRVVGRAGVGGAVGRVVVRRSTATVVVGQVKRGLWEHLLARRRWPAAVRAQLGVAVELAAEPAEVRRHRQPVARLSRPPGRRPPRNRPFRLCT